MAIHGESDSMTLGSRRRADNKAGVGRLEVKCLGPIHLKLQSGQLVEVRDPGLGQERLEKALTFLKSEERFRLGRRNKGQMHPFLNVIKTVHSRRAFRLPRLRPIIRRGLKGPF